MSGAHFHALTVAHIQTEGDEARVVTLEVPPALADTYRFQPGQYLTLKNGELRRSYSICAAPGEAPRVGVRQVPGGAFSTWLHTTLRAGDSIEVMEPEGRFGAALARRPRHVLAVAGGSGITPVLSILKAHLASGPKARATLLYGNRRATSTMFKEELEDLKNRHLTRFTLHAVFSREGVDSPLHAGRLDGEKIATFLRLAGPVDEVFVCGPHAMNDEVEAALLASGLPAGHIHIERFGVPPQAGAVSHEAQPGDASTALITVERDGLVREVPFGAGDESILAAAARAGLDVPYSCKSGVCATCRCKLQEGQVRMARNFALQRSEVAAGFVLACQAHPLTERVRVSFDER
jgi:ring-1,2-phenylacetyl-CoA epoxidase subunit PaaE